MESVGGLDEYDHQQTNIQPHQDFVYIDPRPDGTESSSSAMRPTSSQYVTAAIGEEIHPSGTNARALLGAGRVDPFQALPVHADRSISELIDHCMFLSPCIARASDHLELWALTQMTNRRCYHNACNVLRREMSQASPR